MIDKTVKYIGYYDNVSNRRIVSPAAVSKMNYVSHVTSQICKKVEILSCAVYSKYNDRGHVEHIDENICVRYIGAIKKGKSFFSKLYGYLYSKILIFIFLMINIEQEDIVIVYHSLYNMLLINLIKNIKRVKIILEVEEIYNDVTINKKYDIKKEMNFISNADAFIFPSEIMNNKINIRGKKSLIVYGSYDINYDKHNKFEDGKIHVVYAGTFERVKGGAEIAINSAKYLNNKYVIHILGFGSEQEIDYIKTIIYKVKRNSMCEIIYEGQLLGKEYNDFISKCDIGLSCQNPKGLYNGTSFPSKILSYLCNGLKVVSIRLPVVEASRISDAIIYYDSNDPKKLANAIIKSVLSKKETKDLIKELHYECLNNMSNLISNFEVCN